VPGITRPFLCWLCNLLLTFRYGYGIILLEKILGGVLVEGTVYQQLIEKVGYAKTCIIPRDSLYHAYGMIEMAYKLNAITKEEYFDLNSKCVREGINNPKYF